MTTPKRTNSTASYAALEQRARMDLAASVLADPLASAEHVQEARRALSSTTAGAPTTGAIDFAGWPAPAVLMFRDLLRTLGTTTPHADAELARRAEADTTEPTE